MFYIINGSPRKNGNTAELLHAAADGVRAAGKEIVWVDLYSLNYKGCVSCFACKRKDGNHKCLCACQDELTPVLEGLLHADGIIIGTPIYFRNITGAMQSFVERFLFPNYEYTPEAVCYPGALPNGFIYTMNVDRDKAQNVGLLDFLKTDQSFASALLRSKTEVLYAYNTKQFDDYSKYVVTTFSEEDKDRYRREHFNEDLAAAYAMGQKLANAAFTVE